MNIKFIFLQSVIILAYEWADFKLFWKFLLKEFMTCCLSIAYPKKWSLTIFVLSSDTTMWESTLWMELCQPSQCSFAESYKFNCTTIPWCSRFSSITSFLTWSHLIHPCPTVPHITTKHKTLETNKVMIKIWGKTLQIINLHKETDTIYRSIHLSTAGICKFNSALVLLDSESIMHADGTKLPKSNLNLRI